MSINSLINTVCKEEKDQILFKPLADYFGPLPAEYLLSEDLDDLISLAAPPHRILMSVFVHRFLRPYLQQESFLDKSSVVANQIKPVTLTKGKLDACRSVTSHSMPFNGRVDIAKLKQVVLKLNPAPCSIDFIDLSCNQLTSADVHYVLDLIQELDEYLKDSVILSLENNRIHGVGEYRDTVDEFVNTIASHDKIQFVDMRINPFCTIDRKDFFKQLKAESKVTKHLIWLQKYNVAGYGWTTLVQSEEVVNAVREAHVSYFKTFP